MDRILFMVSMIAAISSPLQAESSATPAELEDVIARWEKRSAEVQTLHARFQRVIYNDLFQVEKRAVGEIAFAAPNKARITVRGAKLTKGAGSRESGHTLNRDRDDIWLWTGTHAYSIDPKKKTYDAFDIQRHTNNEEPSGWLGQFVQHISRPQNCLPFVVGIGEMNLKRRFAITLNEKTDTEIRLLLKPLAESDHRNYRQVEVTLDARSFATTNLRFQDPTGHSETVYVFSEIETNSLGTDDAVLFEANLEGYSGIIH